MSWFSSLKQQSMKLAQLYKNELCDFVTNLNQDLTHLLSEEEQTSIDKPKKPLSESIKVINSVNSSSTSIGKSILMKILQPHLTENLTEEILTKQIMIVLSNSQEYVFKDFPKEESKGPSFQNFKALFNYCSLEDKIYEEVINYEPELRNLLFNNSLSMYNTQKEGTKEVFIRFLYAIVCLLESKYYKRSSIRSISRGIDDLSLNADSVNENLGDALERRSDTSDQFVVIEDAGSSYHQSQSNETEKIEAFSQREVTNVSENDDWQIEDKVCTIGVNKLV